MNVKILCTGSTSLILKLCKLTQLIETCQFTYNNSQNLPWGVNKAP